LSASADYDPRSDSWKKTTVLAAAVEGEETPVRVFLLQILMHYVSSSGGGRPLRRALELKRKWAVEIMTRWKMGGKEEGMFSSLFPFVGPLLSNVDHPRSRRSL
jgi:hypothetical protein